MPLPAPVQERTRIDRPRISPAALKRGSTGRHVHLVQMALIDLGFAMPISTLSQDYSPDGVFGVETEAVVKAFQRSVRAQASNPTEWSGSSPCASSTSGSPDLLTRSTCISARCRSPTFPSNC